jgi:aquaporin Z
MRAPHARLYLIEAFSTALLVGLAGVYTISVQSPGSPLHAWIADPFARRAAIGAAMGATVVAIAYSPWGRRSGAHLNPAVTFTFFRLGRVAPRDLAGYIIAQLLGALAGVAALSLIAREALAEPNVRWYVTVPGMLGVAAAFIGELATTTLLMSAILLTMRSLRLRAATPIVAGAIVALAIAFESPLSGTGLNPARSLATAAFSGIWDGLWIYFTAPIAGMLLAAYLFRDISIPCAKLVHDRGRICQFRFCAFASPATLHGGRS